MPQFRNWSLAALIAAGACRGKTDAQAAKTDGGEVDVSHAQAVPRVQTDPLVGRADSLVRAGRPWRATALLTPRLATPGAAAPALRLVAARAAAAWDGWTEVERLLAGAPWLDAQFGGEGRELLTRSALERGVDALPEAELAVAAADNETSRVTRRVLLARAYDRANQRDAAATEYLAAAMRLPRVADWLRLRAAGVTDDSAARRAVFARIGSAQARARIAPTDAQARERSGDLAGAARVFRRAGAEGNAFRVEGLAARDDATRAATAHRIVGFLGASPASAESRQAIEVLDRLGPLPAGDELVVARAAASAGLASRAVTAFAHAGTSTPLSTADRMTYAGALARAGRSADALRTYATITDPASAPAAAYQHARLLVQSGDGVAARADARDVIERFPSSRAAAAPALLLQADLQMDDGDLPGAERSLRDLIARFPTVSQRPLARFRLGLLDWPHAPAAAAAEFDSLASRPAADDESVAARYWAGRSYERLGRKAEADQRWSEIVRAAPLSYYAVRAAERLHASKWNAPVGADSAVHVSSVDSAVDRITILQRLGMDVEARFEIDALAGRAASAGPAVAQALLAVGEPSRALRVALAAIEQGNTSRALYRFAYPVLHADALVEESRRNGLDPALVAGLIRQESSWNPHAVSAPGARGLMQLMPSVGASIASGRKYPLWNPALLFEPDVSLELGTAHLATSLHRDTPTEQALAAYNAGGSRVARWVKRPGVGDPELFVEWIPFTETRDYVRIVMRNAEVYRALYAGLGTRE